MPLFLTFTSLFASYSTDDTDGDILEPVLIRLKSVVCTFVKGIASKEWQYGLTLEAVRHDVRMACVLLEGDRPACKTCCFVLQSQRTAQSSNPHARHIEAGRESLGAKRVLHGK